VVGASEAFGGDDDGFEQACIVSENRNADTIFARLTLTAYLGLLVGLIAACDGGDCADRPVVIPMGGSVISSEVIDGASQS